MIAHIESFEARHLLSISFSGPEMLVRGTPNADVIEFQRLPRSRSFQIKINGETKGPFRAVYRIHVESMGGDDLVSLKELTAQDLQVAVVEGGSGDDTIYGSGNNNRIFGGGGDDVLVGGKDVDQLVGGSGNDSLLGEARHDTLEGGDGDNTLRGGGGNDLLSAGGGSDVFSGGPGIDWVSYGAEYTKPVDLSLTLDGVANDGRSNEGDQIMSDVENIEAGAGNDLIVGNARNNQLLGDYGNDTIHGGGGNDLIGDGVCIHGPHKQRPVGCLPHEQPFDDELFGDGGDDTLLAYAGADTLHGGPGNDRFELLGIVDPAPSTFLDGGTGADEAIMRIPLQSIFNVENVLDAHGHPLTS